MRDASIAVLREVGVDTGGSNVQFAINPADGRMVVIEMNPRVSRSSALASKATGLPDRQDRGEARGRLHARRAEERHHGRHDAGVVRADDRLRGHQGAALRVREVHAGRRPLTTQMKSVGEVMAIGRTFKESLQKALRGLEIGRRRLQPEDRRPGHDRRRARLPARRAALVRRRRVRHRHDGRGDRTRTRRSTRGSWRRSRRSSTSSSRVEKRTLESLARDELRELKRKGFSDRRLAYLLKVTEADVRARRHALGLRPVYKRVDTCAAEFATKTAYMYSTLRGGVRGRADRPEEGDRARRRPEPDRAGDRVRLLLRARRDGAARGRLRDDHGQLQPGDRLDRLRHVRPAVLRAADARGRAGDRPRREAVGRDRPVRRPDAAEARARPREATACRSSARRRT